MSGSGEGFSPVIPNALPAELASFPPAFCCLLQVVGKGLFSFLFFYYYYAVKTCIDLSAVQVVSFFWFWERWRRRSSFCCPVDDLKQNVLSHLIDFF